MTKKNTMTYFFLVDLSTRVHRSITRCQNLEQDNRLPLLGLWSWILPWPIHVDPRILCLYQKACIKYDTIAKIISINQTQSLLYQWQSTLQVVFMTISNVYYFLHAHREASALVNELPEESDQFRFLRTVCLTNLKVWERSALPILLQKHFALWGTITGSSYCSAKCKMLL